MVALAIDRQGMGAGFNRHGREPSVRRDSAWDDRLDEAHHLASANGMVHILATAGALTAPPPTKDEIDKLLVVVPRNGIENRCCRPERIFPVSRKDDP